MKDQIKIYRQVVTRLGLAHTSTPEIVRGSIRVSRKARRHVVWSITSDLSFHLIIRELDGQLRLHVVMLDDKSMHLFYPKHADNMDWALALEFWSAFTDSPSLSAEETAQWVTAAYECKDTLLEMENDDAPGSERGAVPRH